MKRYRHYKKDKAILLSCFGSVVEDRLYNDLKLYIEEKFSDIDIFLSFSSRMVLKSLPNYKNQIQTLADIDAIGYKNIIVSSINLFPTDEHKLLKDIVKGFKKFSLANIRYTKAILETSKDTTDFLINLNQKISKDNTINLYIIHGTPKLSIEAIESINYTNNLLSYISPLNFVVSLEGRFPFSKIKSFLIEKIKQTKVNNIQIIPMLLVSGNHYIKDMQEIKDELNSLGFNTSIVDSITKSNKFNLIEIEDIRNIITNNIKEEIIKLG